MDNDFWAPVEEHLKSCEDGIERCMDCRFANDGRSMTALQIARLERESINEWLRDNLDVCVYCGMSSDHADHLVPRPWTGTAVRRIVPTVPACSDCNVRIGSALEFTIAGRAAVVAVSLRKKYKKELYLRDRTPKEFAAFGRNMRKNLEAAQSRRQTVRLRLMMLESGGAVTYAIPPVTLCERR